jgi:lysophospholipid acyltransferase (LPLAT)-like uncharacterized protein
VEALAGTWRLTVTGEHHVAAARAAGRTIVFAVWHASLLPPLWHRRGEPITLLMSAHGDGRRLAAAAVRWGYHVVYGSSTRGGAVGVRGLVRALRNGADGAVTPDGPRGPARRAKLGVVDAARHAGAVVVPVAAHAARSWHAHSWDGFMVPRPFAPVHLAYGPAIEVSERRDDRAADAARLEAALEAAEARARCS